MQHLAIVLWKCLDNIDESDDEIDIYDEVATLHITDGQPNPELLKFEKGMSMSTFFKYQRISLQAFMDLCHDCVIVTDKENPPTWDSKFRKCTISRNRDFLTKLDCLLNMPITLYEGEKNGKKPPKHIYYTGP